MADVPHEGGLTFTDSELRLQLWVFDGGAGRQPDLCQQGVPPQRHGGQAQPEQRHERRGFTRSKPHAKACEHPAAKQRGQRFLANRRLRF